MVLRVGIVTPRYPPGKGGVEEVVANQARVLSERGHRVEVLTHVNDRAGTGTSAEGQVTVHRYRGVTGSERYPVAPGLYPALRRAAGRFDVVDAHHFHDAAALSVLGLPAGVPVVFTPHLHGGGHTAGARLMHIFYRPLGRRLFDRADRVVCVSNAEAELVAAMFPAAAARTAVVRNGLRLRGRPSGPYDGRSAPLLLSVGRLEHYKRQDLAVQALAHLPGWELAVVGDGPAAGDLRDLAARAGVADRVHFTGRVSDDHLGPWLARAWAFVSMSEREAFGLTLLEAAAWGIPVVASGIPAHREVSGLVPGAVELVTTGTDPASLAGSVARAAKPMTEVAPRSWVGDLSWAGAGQSLEAVYRNLVEPATTPTHDLDSRPTLSVT